MLDATIRCSEWRSARTEAKSGSECVPTSHRVSTHSGEMAIAISWTPVGGVLLLFKAWPMKVHWEASLFLW